MADTHELTMDDYLVMARRRLKVVIVPLLIAPIAGFLISYVFTPKYQSQATVQVVQQKVPSNFVEPVITQDFVQRVTTLSSDMMSPNKLQPVVSGLGLAKPGEEAKVMESIRTNLQVVPAITQMSQASAGISGKKKSNGLEQAVQSVNLIYSDSNPESARKICQAMADLMVTENLKSRGQIAKDTKDFLSGQVAAAKEALDNQDAEIANFKREHWGQLPGDIENNMKSLQSMSSQLDATTQSLSRAQQDKAYAESMLSQQLSAWKNSQSSTSPQTLQQQLTTLQAQLLQLQARYTDDHPDVIKTKADIAKVQQKLDEIDKQASTASQASDKANVNEPAEIRQLRLQIHQYQQVIDQSTSDQKKLQAAINVYQARTSTSPEVEEKFKVLNRDYDTKQRIYDDLLKKQSSADLGNKMESNQEGEQMTIGASASKAESPTFPNRILFAAGGLGAGLGLGLLIAIWLEFSDKSIRTERDAAMAMDLPLLISVPWVGEQEHVASNGNGQRHFWGRGAPHKDDKVGV